MKQTTQTISVDNQKVAVKIHDRESDHAWVFLHGWGSRKEVWQPIVSNLSETTVLVDLPGFGASSDLKEPWTIDNYDSAIRKLVTKLDYSSVILAGHSFGGQIASALAAGQPDWLDGLVLVNAAAVRDEQPKLLSVIGSWVSPFFNLPGIRQIKNGIYDLIGADRPPSDYNLRATMRNILRSDQSEKLAQISVPTKIIWGQHDTVTPLDEGLEIADAVPDADLSILDGTHYIFLDTPEAFLQELKSFAKSLSS